MNGIIKEFYETGELKYEGMYENGIMKGEGIIYSTSGKKRFEGIFNRDE